MPRQKRYEIPGAWYHVTQRGNDGKPIFADGDDCAFFLSFLTRVVARESWTCFAYCLMTNHYHLIMRIREPNLARGMGWLNGVYAQYFNRRHGRCGHLFGGRYRTGFIETDEHLVEACQYVELNPVRAGMCKHEAGWRCSSARPRAGLDRTPPFLTLDID